MRYNRGIAYQAEAASFGQDLPQTFLAIGMDMELNYREQKGGKAADVPPSASVVSEQEVTDYCTVTHVSSLLRGQYVDLQVIPTENVIAEKEPGVDKLKQTTTSVTEKQKLKLQKQLGSYNNDKATDSSAPMGKRKKKLTKY